MSSPDSEIVLDEALPEVSEPLPLASEDRRPPLTEIQTKIRERFLSQTFAISVSLDKKDVAGFKEPNPYYVYLS